MWEYRYTHKKLAKEKVYVKEFKEKGKEYLAQNKSR